LKKLLLRLSTRHSVRFKGFNAKDADEGLGGIIERAGLFAFPGPSGEVHGSLLQDNGLEKVLRHAGLDDAEEHGEARGLLRELTRAISDYASLKDALSIVGDRPAFLLRTEPTARAHDAIRKQLLSRLGTPVFISRPIPEFFDVIDPSADTGGGIAAYSLQLDRKCFWRQAAQNDRQDVDYESNTTNTRMKWRSFRPGQLISWKPIPVLRKDGNTDSISSFDLAVVLASDGKVVVFRNQKVFFGDSKKQVLDQARHYLTRRLRLPVGAIEEAVRVRSQASDQYTGTLMYSYLAGQAARGKLEGTSDIEVLTTVEFEEKRRQEDDF
jgi:hypothetical protein